jgi:hypothetical protein
VPRLSVAYPIRLSVAGMCRTQHETCTSVQFPRSSAGFYNVFAMTTVCTSSPLQRPQQEFTLGWVCGAILLLITCLLTISCSPFFVPQAKADSSAVLLHAAREYGKNHQPLPTFANASLPVTNTPDHAAINPTSLYSKSTESEYVSDVRGSFTRREFDKLEKEVTLDRGGARLPGGAWRLAIFYNAISSPGDNPQDDDIVWTVWRSLLQDWAAAKPDSATPRIAIAEMYVNYAAAARGNGYADSVSDQGWRLFNERVEKSTAALGEAAKMKEKCPFWFEVAQQIALDQSWNKEQARELLELAAAFEPTYYHYYREYANYLLPKWLGQPGDTEAFAEEVSKRVKGQQGQFLYFEISSQLFCQCISERPPMPNVSWPRVKEGYATLGKLYGYSDLKNNRMAFMAYVADDKTASQEAFSRITSEPEHSVWRSAEAFQRVRTWAAGEQALN